MTPEFSNAVDYVFLCVLDVKSRIEWGQAQPEQVHVDSIGKTCVAAQEVHFDMRSEIGARGLDARVDQP